MRTWATEDPSALEETPYDPIIEIDGCAAEPDDDADEIETAPMTGRSTDHVYMTFFDAISYGERVTVIMLDEIDKLVEKLGDDMLYDPSRINSELDNSCTPIMGTSDDLKFTDFLDPRVKPNLSEEEIVFSPYDVSQLRGVLQHRADVVFKPGTLIGDAIPLCVAFTVQEHGDARRVLDLLHTAGELVGCGQVDAVEEAHIR